MDLKVDLDYLWECFEGMWEDVGKGNLSEALDMLDVLLPECRERIEEARDRIPSGNVCVVLDGDEETGEALVFQVTQGPFIFPSHIHNRSSSARYGERIWTIEGEITDVDEFGEELVQTESDVEIEHAPETRHQPRVDDWWVGIVYQPAGSRLV